MQKVTEAIHKDLLVDLIKRSDMAHLIAKGLAHVMPCAPYAVMYRDGTYLYNPNKSRYERMEEQQRVVHTRD